MKHLTLIFFFLLFSSVQGQIVIKGKILNYDGKTKLYYVSTIEGIHTPYWIDVMPSASGNFKIEFENEGFGVTTVGFKSTGGPRYRFFHDADSKIYFEFDQGIVESLQKNQDLVTGNTTRGNFIRNEATTVMRSDYEGINKFYNSNIRTTIYSANNLSGTFYSRLLLKEKSPERAVFILDSLKQLEIDQIMKLPFTVSLENEQQGKKEKEIKEFLINEVQTFYGSVFMNAMIIKRQRQIKQNLKDSTSNQNIYNREWEELVEEFILDAIQNQNPIPNSADYKDFLNLLLVSKNNYQLKTKKEIKPAEEYVINRFYNYDTMVIKDPKTLFSHQLYGLDIYLNMQTFYSPALLDAYYGLQSQHPDSGLLKHYEPQVDKLKAYLKSTKNTFDKGVIINRNHKSFESLLGGFKGKNVLIDIWATWCHPCIEDFKYKQMIQPFIDSLQLEMLYISFDKSEWEDKWKNSIKFNKLEGHHFRANKKFIEDLWLELGGMVNAIPRYALVDKQGKLFLSTASRPSEGNKLVEEINELLKKSE